MNAKREKKEWLGRSRRDYLRIWGKENSFEKILEFWLEGLKGITQSSRKRVSEADRDASIWRVN